MRKTALAAVLLAFGTPVYALGLSPMLPVSVICPGEDKNLTVIFEDRQGERMRVRGTFDHGLQDVDIAMAPRDGDFTIVESMTGQEAQTPSDRMSYLLRGYLVATDMQACKASAEARRLFGEMLKATRPGSESPDAARWTAAHSRQRMAAGAIDLGTATA